MYINSKCISRAFLLIALFKVIMAYSQQGRTDASIWGHTNLSINYDKTFYLTTWYSPQPIDSTICNLDGDFIFKTLVKPSDKGFAIGQKNNNGKILYNNHFIIENGETVKIDINKKSIVFNHNQGKSNERYFNGVNEIFSKSHKFTEVAQEGENTDSLVTCFLFTYIDSIINIDPFVGLELIQSCEHLLFYTYTHSKKYLNSFYDKLDKLGELHNNTFKQNPIFLRLNQQIREGKVIPNIRLFDLNEEEFDLEQYRNNNNYLLLDFGASWCAPCLEKNMKLKAVYHNYQKYNFEVLGISIDESKGAFLYSVEKNKFPWKEVWLDFKSDYGKEIMKQFRLYAIPLTILISPDGKVIKFNPNIEEIEAELLKK